MNEALVTLRGQNKRLDERLARADAGRLAALDEVRQTQAEMAKKLETAADEVKQAKAELTSRREELEINHRKLAEANGAREQIKARVIAMEKRVKTFRRRGRAFEDGTGGGEGAACAGGGCSG